MYSFTTFNFARLRQAEKGEYYQQVVDMVESSGLDGKIAAGQWTAFKTDTRHYFQLVSQHAASTRTVRMKRYDRARNAVFQHLRLGLKMMQYSEDPEVAEYYHHHVRPIINRFKGYDVKTSAMDRTADFRAFCRDVKKLKAGMLRRAFVCREEADKLLELCQKFEDTYVDRNLERTRIESVPALLESIHAQWQHLSAAFVVMANQDITDLNRADVEAARRLINTVNAHTDYYSIHYIRKTRQEKEPDAADDTASDNADNSADSPGSVNN